MTTLLETYFELLTTRDLFSAKRLQKNADTYTCHKQLACEMIAAVDKWGSRQGFAPEDLVDCYLEVNRMMQSEKLAFLRTGEYAHSDYGEAYRNIYSNANVMQRYMIGLALSELLWEAHFEMFRFFLKHIRLASGEKYLEIGPGHGLFFLFARNNLPSSMCHTVIDVSDTSIQMTKEMLVSNNCSMDSVSFHVCDFLEGDSKEQFDFIQMGEVLEHVPNPDTFIRKVRSLLKPGGRVLVTTAINSPAIDHIYHFRNVDSVESMFLQEGLKILDSLIIPEARVPREEWETKRINVNVSYVLLPSDDDTTNRK